MASVATPQVASGRMAAVATPQVASGHMAAVVTVWQSVVAAAVFVTVDCCRHLSVKSSHVPDDQGLVPAPACNSTTYIHTHIHIYIHTFQMTKAL